MFNSYKNNKNTLIDEDIRENCHVLLGFSLHLLIEMKEVPHC